MDAINVINVSKKFSIWYEKKKSIYDYIFNPSRKAETLIALNKVSFSLKKGECLGVIGKNGSGKTTLLKIISGILRPDEGKVVITGKIVPFIELGVGFEPDFTGRENIYLYGSLLGIPKKEIDKQLDEIILNSGVEKFIDMPLKKYSTGMKIRLAFTTASLCNPDILLIDEIFSVGDLSFQRKSIMRIRDFKKKGKSIILVSHSLSEIRSICDRVILLDKGSLVHSGNVDAVVDFYTNLIFLEDKKRLTDEINQKISQINELEKRKCISESTDPEISETVTKLQQEYTYSIRELKSLVYDALEIQKRQINSYEAMLHKARGKIPEETKINLPDPKKTEYLLEKTRKKKLSLLNQLKDILYAQIEQPWTDKFALFQELQALFESNQDLTSSSHLGLHEMKNIIYKELQNTSNEETKQKLACELKQVMSSEFKTVRNINKKIHLIGEYLKFIDM
jgi:ABC-type polysaccharide/polyol phosphate transport system ATPase subunit